MLVLVAGVTGNIGQKLIPALLSRGHSVRGLGRSPDKLPEELRSSLESFVKSDAYYDVPNLEKASKGVDAVICAYVGLPELLVEGQLLLLRAAEKAGVKRYVAASWNYDWSEMKLGQHESYDPFLCFRRLVEISTNMKPIYMFTGVLAEVLFATPGHGDFAPKNNGIWDSEKKEMHIYGSGKQKWQWTCERDAAEFTAAIVERDDAEQGGYWYTFSDENTLEEIAQTYEEVKGCKVSIVRRGTEEDLRREAFEARAKGSPNNYWGYIGYFYQLFTVDGTWLLRRSDHDKLAVKRTSLRKFLQENSDA